jgi:hypothetical protein
MNDEFFRDEFPLPEVENENLGGTNFLVSAVMLLKRQKSELLAENEKLKAELALLQTHNAALVNVSADRLLGKTV